MTMDLTVPANATATVRVPASDAADVHEGGTAASRGTRRDSPVGSRRGRRAVGGKRVLPLHQRVNRRKRRP